jgi:hypothetical protein
MAIKNTTTIKLERENIAGEYGEGWQYVWLGDGDRISIEVGDDLDEVIAFLQRVQDMNKPPSPEPAKPTPSVWLPNCKPGDVCVRRDGEKVKYHGRNSDLGCPHKAGDNVYTDAGCYFYVGKEDRRDIVATIPSDHSGPSGTACDTIAKEYAR